MLKTLQLDEHAQYLLNKVKKTLLALPGTEEYTCWDTPAFRVKRKLIARLKEDGETLVVHADDRDVWMDAHPGFFYVTEHYFNYSYVLIRLNAIPDEVLGQVLTEAWQQVAPKIIRKAWLISKG
jgi:hypothetical protein